MLASLEKIRDVKYEDFTCLKEQEWLKYLFLKDTLEGINVEHFSKVASIKPTSTLDYVERTLEVLEKCIEVYQLTPKEVSILEETLCWCEVAKGGSKKIREEWKKQGYILYAHNIGSSQIYASNHKKPYTYVEYVRTLIATHGLIGQYIRGEVKLEDSFPLALLKKLSDVDNQKVVTVLNHCIIEALGDDLFGTIWGEVLKSIAIIFSKKFKEETVLQRVKRLRAKAILRGEKVEEFLSCKEQEEKLKTLFSYFDFWYFEAALDGIGFKEVLNLLNYLVENVAGDTDHYTNISFEPMMQTLYCDYQGKKQINIFKQRVIEKLLRDVDFDKGTLSNEFVRIELKKDPNEPFIFVQAEFSKFANSFLDTCMKASGQGAIYDKFVYMACDYFGLRRDEYDRFYNEEIYLQTMGESTVHKKILIDYLVHGSVADIGPGDGSLMSEIERRYKDKKIVGVDISKNVIQALKKKKNLENHSWMPIKGNTLKLSDIFAKGEISNFILCSVAHEFASYPILDNKPFNKEAVLRKIFTDIYELLPVGGRLLIRDGIMTESDEKRCISFKDPEGPAFLEMYAKDFKGRKISYTKLDEKRYVLPINDAMEFLYTYTWGKDSYAQEVQEQFGYFYPNEYIAFIKECFKDHCKVIYTDHYLQDGYEEHLLPKIDFYKEDGKEKAKLPDSTFILVVEKTN